MLIIVDAEIVFRHAYIVMLLCILQAIKDKVLAKADIMEATGDAIASFGEVHCLTPR